MNFNTDKTLFLGINNDGDLVILELNFNDLNKGTKFYNPHYHITPHGYTDIKDEETGKEEARETLQDREYWDGLGMIDSKSFLNDFINFDDVADRVINTDGWEMTNGEYYYLDEYENLSYYINLNWIGHEDKTFNKNNYKKVYVSDGDFNFLRKNKKDIKEKDKEKIKEIKTIFSKYQDTKPIIKDMLEEQENQN